MKLSSLVRSRPVLLLGLLLAGLRLSAGLASHEAAGASSSPAPAPKAAPAVTTPPPAAATSTTTSTPLPTAPAADGVVSFAPSYTFTTTDALSVSVYDESDLNAQARVDTTGCITLPLINKIRIAGLTISEAQKAIEKAYQDQRFLRHPQVTIAIQSVATREVSIQGQVRTPGRYPLPIETSMSVVDLVTKAGGFTDIANGNKVSITHFDLEGKAHVHVVDVDAIIKGRVKASPDDQSLMLQPNDIVYVPESMI
jgi:polysaccharide export outer membrane protein